jgi:hypothetical protein
MNTQVVQLGDRLKSGDKAKTVFGHEIVIGQIHTDEHGRRWVEPKDSDETDWLIPAENIVAVNGRFVAGL